MRYNELIADAMKKNKIHTIIISNALNNKWKSVRYFDLIETKEKEK